MSEYRDTINYVSQSVFKLISGSITEIEFATLEDILIHDEAARKHYYELNYVIVAMKNTEGILGLEEVLNFDMDLLHDMAEYEKTAPEVVLSQEEPQTELIQKVVYPPFEKRKMSKFNIVFVAMSAAALLFFFLFIELAPPKGVKVATLTDSLHAKWLKSQDEMVNGASIATSDESLLLSDGFAELLFNNQAKVTIEGPAEFKILAEDQIKLSYGRLYAMVPREAIGFTVKTPFAQIVDLGTEFGVDCSLHSDTSLHVMKGKTVLIAGDESNKVSIEVAEGVAKKVLAATQTVSDIPCDDRLFAREINSASDLIWRGETEISLADIVGGGNGFGTGRLNYGIMIDTGRLSTGPLFIGNYNIHHKVTQDFFRSVPEFTAVDGIFVPDGGAGAVVVSSQGHLFEGCPDTSSTWCVPIINGAKYKSDSDVQFQIKGQAYGTAEKPGLFLHANIGITYDLGVIRGLLPAEKTLTRFASIGSALDSSSFGQPGLVDIWVLVDGQVRFSHTNVAPSECFDIDVPLSGEDHFLSLVVTDGISDVFDGKRNKDGFDWFLFGTPGLIIE